MTYLMRLRLLRFGAYLDQPSFFTGSPIARVRASMRA
jgi:hypothetical protein